MATANLQQNLRDQHEQRLAAEVASAASLNSAFPADPDAVLAEEVKKITDSSEERALLRSEDAREEYDNLTRANLIRGKEKEQERKDGINRYHSAQQARDQRAEAEVSRRFSVLAQSQQGPENAWAMSPERLKYLAQTAEMAAQFVTPEQLAALNSSVDPFIQTEQLAAQLPERQQVPSNQQRPETFPDGSLVQVQDFGNGTLEARLITGEVFRGDALTVTRKIGEANVHTKRWAKEQRAQQPQCTASRTDPDESKQRCKFFARWHSASGFLEDSRRYQMANGPDGTIARL
jgi:hypothetical protein